ncbi:protein PLANT CADMIUM RESISTANCE 7-like [Selaginella moellendorffii]|uniref:protein PLANT CADMIUM RESISTANCE 7-like n=1 Tax=Selaginella moellendorffii TaxID=88036 RepID=UPI000D1CCC1E|nr:protein PLANT CADMIUM RESISTANCE 7-like [Selaginella moellendorffii]|eukprot:XP_024526561.1 protein PLANT CADMIUM RESISTANCE 7-like [Selaginella moellendorffii]
MAYTDTPQSHPTQQHQGQQQGFTSEGHPVAPPAAHPQPPPGSYYGPGVATMAPPNSGLWPTGLYGCTEDCPSCWCALCCPCVLVGRMANILDQGMTSVFTGAAIFCGCGCLYSCLYRAKLRHKYGLPEEPCNDICTEWWCNCCSIAQAYRELRNRNINPALGYEFARAVYEQPPQVQEMRKM